MITSPTPGLMSSRFSQPESLSIVWARPEASVPPTLSVTTPECRRRRSPFVLSSFGPSSKSSRPCKRLCGESAQVLLPRLLLDLNSREIALSNANPIVNCRILSPRQTISEREFLSNAAVFDTGPEVRIGRDARVVHSRVSCFVHDYDGDISNRVIEHELQAEMTLA